MSTSRRVLLISILASFVAFLDGSVVNVALPSITREFGGGLFLQQWTSDAYLITLGALILIAGSLADLFGQRRIMTIGLYGFLVASLLCTLAPSGTMLILARALQGVAGALLVPSSLSLIIATFSGDEQARAIGSWTAWTGISFIVGPLVGGILVDTLSWRWIFALNVLPIAVTLTLLRRLDTPERINPNARVDYRGAVLCSLGLAAIVYALIEQPAFGWSHPIILGALIAGCVLLVLFIRHEATAAQPMLPLDLFRVRNFSVGNAATFAVYAGLSIAIFLITIFMQETGNYSALQAGMATIPVTILMFFLSPRFGALSSKFGPRLFMGIGPIVSSLGFLLMLFVDARVEYWTGLFPGIILFGLGLSITVAPLTAAVLGGIDSAHAGIGSAVNNAVSRIAGLIAIAGIGLIIGNSMSVAAFHNGVITIAILLFLGGVISLIGIQNHPKR